MSINDLIHQWQSAVEKLQDHKIEEFEAEDLSEELCDVQGLHIRSSILAGGPYMPKMTLYQGCSQYCK